MSDALGTGAGGFGWRNFLKRHWHAVGIFLAACALVLIEAVYVFLWFVGSAQSSGQVPRTLGLWAMSDVVTFILYTIFWEALLVGIPMAFAGVVAWQWWKRLPADERVEYRFPGRSRTTRGGGGLSFLIFIAFCIKVYTDSKWDAAIATFTLDYVVGSFVTILIWGVVIIGIPATIGLSWWLRREMRKP